jgi:hypothetical protein
MSPRSTPAKAALLALALSAIAPAAGHSASCMTLWSRTYHGAGVVNERAQAAGHDYLSNPIVAGYSDATGISQGNNWLIKKYNYNTGAEIFTKTVNFSAVAAQSDDRATALAVDPVSGSFYVAGFVDASSENTNRNWMLQKYTSTGTLLWSRTQSCEINGAPPTDDEDGALGVAVDISGSVVVAGYESDVWGTRKNFVVRKYDAEGSVLWTASHNGSTSDDDVASAVCTDADGNIIAVGYETVGASRDALIIKYDPSGAPLWNDVWGSVGMLNDEFLGVGVDASGSIFAVGYTRDLSDNTLVMKYSPGGVRLWLDAVDGPAGGDDRLNAVTVRPDGIFAAGGYTVRSDLGEGMNWLFGKYDSEGNQVWGDTYNSPGNSDDALCGISYDSSTRLVVAGYETRPDRVADLGGGEDWRVFRYQAKFACPKVSFVPSKNQVFPGDDFTATLAVFNGGEGAYSSVSTTVGVSSGPASVTRTSGTTPTVVPTLNPGSSVYFTSYWRAVAPGAVNISTTVTGSTTSKIPASCGVIVVSSAPDPGASSGSMGRDFWLAFMLDEGAPTSGEYSVLVTGPAGTSVTVTTPWGPLPVSGIIPASRTLRLKVDETAGVNSSGFIEQRGVHVTANADISAYAFDCHSCIMDVGGNWSSDGTLVLPTETWGCEYLVLGYGRPANPRTQLIVLSGQAGTSVWITPSATVGANLKGVPFNVLLDQGEVYRLALAAGADDLAGTVVTANKPVAVFGGAIKTGVPLDGAADGNHLYEQMLPTKYWGTRYITTPLGGRLLGDTFMMMAADDDTGVSVSGAPPFLLDRGETREMIISGPAEITSDKPLALAQYSNSHIYDLRPGDPAMMLVPSVDQYVLDAWVPSTSSTLFSDNYLGVVVPSSGAGSIQVDGVAVSATCFLPAGTSGYSGAALWVDANRHHVTGTTAFGLQAYGFFTSGTFADAYAWTGPLALAARSRLEITGPTGAERWQTYTFTIKYMNREVHPANFLFWDTIPAGTSLVSVSDGGTEFAGAVAWTINGVPAGGTGQVTFSLRITSSTESLRQQVLGYYETTAAQCQVSLASNTLVVPVSAPAPAPVKVYPNPFNPAKAVNGSLKFRGIRVGGKLHIFTLSGRLVWEAVAGKDPVEWNGKNTKGEKVVAGIYLWAAEGETGKERGKIFLQR